MSDRHIDLALAADGVCPAGVLLAAAERLMLSLRANVEALVSSGEAPLR